MKKTLKFACLLLLSFTLVATGCASSKKGQCGCPSKRGMVGY